jgi:hypothetical protein
MAEFCTAPSRRFAHQGQQQQKTRRIAWLSGVRQAAGCSRNGSWWRVTASWRSAWWFTGDGATHSGEASPRTDTTNACVGQRTPGARPNHEHTPPLVADHLDGCTDLTSSSTKTRGSGASRKGTDRVIGVCRMSIRFACPSNCTFVNANKS